MSTVALRQIVGNCLRGVGTEGGEGRHKPMGRACFGGVITRHGRSMHAEQRTPRDTGNMTSRLA